MSEGHQQQSSRFSLAGKVAVVTGGHRGIGRDISLGLGRAGSDVIVIDRGGPGDSDVPSQLSALGRRHWSVVADVGDVSALRRAGEAAQAVAGRVDVLVNNAGVSAVARLEEATVEDWDETMRVNLRAPFVLAQTVARGEGGMLAAGRGAIVNVSSVAGSGAVEGHAAYGAAKAGLNMLTRVMACEWGGRGIRANAVAPTVVLTAMGRRVWGGSEQGERLRERIPAGRFVEGREVADVVVFLASEAGSMVNGEVVHVDGGLHVW